MMTLTKFIAGALLTVAMLAAAQSASRAQTTKRLLFLTHAGLYKHTSLGPAEKAVIELGKTGGFDVTTVEGYKLDWKEAQLRVPHAPSISPASTA